MVFVKSFFVAISVLAVALLFSLFLNRTFAGDSVVELREIKLEYRKFFKNGRDPLISEYGMPDKTLDKEIVLHLDTDILDYLYWNNTIHSMTDMNYSDSKGGQFRTIGWRFHLGIRVSQTLEVEYRHHSQHILDATLPYGFPVNDAVGFNLILYSKNPKKDSLL